MAKRRLGGPLVAVVLLVVLFVGPGCGDAEITQDRFRTQLVESGEGRISPERAECVTDALFEELDQEDIEVLYAAQSADDVPEATARRLERAIEACTAE